VLVLHHARLGSRGRIVDLAIDDGQVSAITPGGSASVPPDGKTVDLEGRTVLPAMWDAHVHLVQWAAARRRIDLAEAASAADAVALVTAAVERRAGDHIISGFGFRDGIWPDQPHKDLLEAAVPGRPIALLSNDLHTVWLSPAALALVGRTSIPPASCANRTACARSPRSPRHRPRPWTPGSPRPPPLPPPAASWA
jgi:predicted amidohydrolase YtcJ